MYDYSAEHLEAFENSLRADEVDKRKQRRYEETLDALSKLLAETELVNGPMFRTRSTTPSQSKR